MPNGMVKKICLLIELIKNILLYKTNYFRKLHTRSKNKIKFELYLSNYETKSDLKDATNVDTSKFDKRLIYLTENQILKN